MMMIREDLTNVRNDNYDGNLQVLALIQVAYIGYLLYAFGSLASFGNVDYFAFSSSSSS